MNNKNGQGRLTALNIALSAVILIVLNVIVWNTVGDVLRPQIAQASEEIRLLFWHVSAKAESDCEGGYLVISAYSPETVHYDITPYTGSWVWGDKTSQEWKVVATWSDSTEIREAHGTEYKRSDCDPPASTNTPQPTATEEPSSTPQPTATTDPTQTTVPSETPLASSTPESTPTTGPEATPVATEKPTQAPPNSAWLGFNWIEGSAGIPLHGTFRAYDSSNAYWECHSEGWQFCDAGEGHVFGGPGSWIRASFTTDDGIFYELLVDHDVPCRTQEIEYPPYSCLGIGAGTHFSIEVALPWELELLLATD